MIGERDGLLRAKEIEAYESIASLDNHGEIVRLILAEVSLLAEKYRYVQRHQVPHIRELSGLIDLLWQEIEMQSASPPSSARSRKSGPIKRTRLRMVRDEDQRLALDSPRLKLRQEIHAEDVEAAKARRGDDLQVARDDIAGAKLMDAPGLGRCDAVGGPQHDRGQPGAGVDPGGAGGGLEIAVTVAPLSISIRVSTPLIEATTQKWPSGAMLHAQFLADDALVVEPERSVRRASSGW